MKSLVMPVVGMPNVGKSTIVNAILGDKVSIVTHKPHTTRSLIMGAKKYSDAEVVFVDTPGIGTLKSKLGLMITKSMQEYLNKLDEMILVLDASFPRIERFAQFVSKSIIVLNKIDRVHKPKLLPLINNLKELGAKEIFLISAKSGDGLKELTEYLHKRSLLSVDGPYDLPKEDIVHFAAECVREKILLQCQQEVPHNIWVEPTYVKFNKDSAWNIGMNIIVPKKAYKSIIIGKGGESLKKIGMAARIELSMKLKQSGHLQLEVVLDEDLWKKDHVYQKLGLMK